jgi:hypothetical protein
MSGESGFQNPTWKDLAEKALDLRAQVAGLEAEIKALDETVKRLEESARLDSAALAKVNAEYAEVTSQLENVRRSMMRAQDELAKHLVYARLSEGDILPRGGAGAARYFRDVAPLPARQAHRAETDDGGRTGHCRGIRDRLLSAGPVPPGRIPAAPGAE